VLYATLMPWIDVDEEKTGNWGKVEAHCTPIVYKRLCPRIEAQTSQSAAHVQKLTDLQSRLSGLQTQHSVSNTSRLMRMQTQLIERSTAPGVKSSNQYSQARNEPSDQAHSPSMPLKVLVESHELSPPPCRSNALFQRHIRT